MSLSRLREASEDEQRERGYYHTLREILQQPVTWPKTAEKAAESGISLEGSGPVLLTGSGSSHYIGESLEPVLGKTLRRSVRATPAGSLLTDLESYLSRDSSGTLVSFARSGDSPESCAIVDSFLDKAPDWRHVVVTCNRDGALATRYGENPKVSVLALPEETNDRSLVMTSSFTNLWLAGRILGGGSPDVSSLARTALSIFETSSPFLAEAGSKGFTRAVYLGGGSRYGAAREGALKMLEMTDGRVATFAETYLGLRHGPMCALGEPALLVGLLSSAEPHRSYEKDLLEELDQKKIASFRVLVGSGGDVSFDIVDDDRAILDVVVTQLLGLFRSLSLGLRPDSPSAGGVISRVVRRFEIH